MSTTLYGKESKNTEIRLILSIYDLKQGFLE